MNILLVANSELSMASGIHVVNLASALRELGIRVAIAVPGAPCLVPGPTVEDPRPYSKGVPVTFYQQAAQLRFEGGATADLVHAWGVRPYVTGTARALSQAHHCPYLAHLEDNDHVITASFAQIDVAEMKRRAAEDAGFALPPFLAHPRDMGDFLAGAVGVTALIEPLLEFKPSETPGLVVWPAAEDDLFFPRPRDPGLVERLGIDPGTRIIVYNGNVHPLVQEDMNALYGAVLHLADNGLPIVLVRIGRDVGAADLYSARLKDLIIRLPFQPRQAVPRLLALADALVQPGKASDFNDYRFPSKLPEFFAMGRPVILPRTNIGLHVEDGQDALLLQRGDIAEIAEKLSRVMTDADLSARLEAGARRFYERMFNWKRSAAKLLEFYHSLV